MMKMKKFICLAACAAIAVGSFAGCSDKKESGTNGVTTVTIWTGGSSDYKVQSKMIEDWNKTEGKKKGVKIDYQLKADDSLQQSLEIALKAGNAPDIFYSGDMKSYAENKYIASIDELTCGDELIKKFKDKIVDEKNMVGDKIYTLPYGSNLRGMIYNKDLFKKAGIVDSNGEAKPPKTFDEYREYAKKITNEAEGIYGAIYPMKWTGWYGSDITTLVQQNAGHSGYNPVNGKYEYDAFTKLMQYALDIYKDGSVYPDTEGLDNDTARALFAEGKIGIKMAYDFDVAVLNYQFPAKCDWGVAPLPLLDENNAYYQRMTYGISPYVSQKAVEEKKDAVSAAFEFLMSDEYVIDLYKNACKFPYDYDLIKDVKLGKDTPKGWKEFGEMLEVSRVNNLEPKTDMTNVKSIGDRFVEYCWTGKKTPKQVTDEYVQDLYKAQEAYYKNNPNESPDKYLDPNWNIKR